MPDERIEQLKSEAEREAGLEKSKAAFKGFARSSDTASKVDKVYAELDKRISALTQVIALEEQYTAMVKQGASGESLKGLGEQLNSAKANLDRLIESANQRQSSLSQELMKTGNEASAQQKVNATRGAKSYAKPINKNLPRYAKLHFGTQKITPRHAKLARPTMPKQNIVYRKSISDITKPSRAKSFGRQMTLTNKPA